MIYIKRYDTYNDFVTNEHSVSGEDEYVDSIVPGVAGIKTDLDAVWYNQVPSNAKMTVAELIAAGYAEQKADGSRRLPGYEVNYNVIQIHSDCPIKLENITDFDTQLVSSTTFVWREELPARWDPVALAAKYNNVELARTIMIEMFPCVDFSGVNSLSLSFAGAEYYYTHSSIVTERYKDDNWYYPNSKFKAPTNLTVTIRGVYTSVAQCIFSMLKGTKNLTINCGGVFSCHDMTGLFEASSDLETLTITGPFRWDGPVLCHNMFDGCSKLTSIPHVSSWGRDDEAAAIYNTLYPRFTGVRGSADCSKMFNNMQALTFLGPRINMNAISLNGCVADGQNQSALGYNMFNCPNLEDVRIINLNNNDWNFADGSTYTYIPKMNTTSIEFLLNHVVDCSSNPHTVTFSDLHENDVSSSAISAAAAKGWTVVWQAEAA